MSLQEASYQSVEMSKEYAKHEVMNGWFCNQLCSDMNTYETNKELDKVIKTMDVSMLYSIGRGNPNGRTGQRHNSLEQLIETVRNCKVLMTFEMLRRIKDWKITLERIIQEEVSNISLGSSRGFETFVYRPLCNRVIARTIKELWALPVITRALNTYARIWIERNYAPGGKGYISSYERFNTNACNMQT
tara:strand:- start:97 stop:663 length:567 start_codon:yes stop_codon:yes gene_type:complete